MSRRHVLDPPADPTPGYLYCRCGFMFRSRETFELHVREEGEADA